jgi:NAD(P)-dependent dehydrogenase (short-subunit alcohol dehydrogenase family)
MRIAVTGGSGKLGRHVVRRLTEDGHQVLNLDSRACRPGWCTLVVICLKAWRLESLLLSPGARVSVDTLKTLADWLPLALR